MALNVSFQLILSNELKKLLKESSKPIDRETAETVGNTVIKEMKDLIRNGVSPIRGVKFPPYKNKRRYPGKRKPSSPVNLKLSGDFLDALTKSTTPGQYGPTTVIQYEASQEIKEKGHREGANGQPSRPTLPSGNGEQFTRGIRELYVEIYRQRILEVLKGKG